MEGEGHIRVQPGLTLLAVQPCLLTTKLGRLFNTFSPSFKVPSYRVIVQHSVNTRSQDQQEYHSSTLASILLWLCRVNLWKRMDIAKSRTEQQQSLDPSWRPNLSQAVTDEELNSYAFDMCRCIPHFVEPSSGTQGHIGVFLPLAVVLMHFKARQNWK